MSLSDLFGSSERERYEKLLYLAAKHIHESMTRFRDAVRRRAKDESEKGPMVVQEWNRRAVLSEIISLGEQLYRGFVSRQCIKEDIRAWIESTDASRAARQEYRSLIDATNRQINTMGVLIAESGGWVRYQRIRGRWYERSGIELFTRKNYFTVFLPKDIDGVMVRARTFFAAVPKIVKGLPDLAGEKQMVLSLKYADTLERFIYHVDDIVIHWRTHDKMVPSEELHAAIDRVVHAHLHCGRLIRAGHGFDYDSGTEEWTHGQAIAKLLAIKFMEIAWAEYREFGPTLSPRKGINQYEPFYSPISIAQQLDIWFDEVGRMPPAEMQRILGAYE